MTKRKLRQKTSCPNYKMAALATSRRRNERLTTTAKQTARAGLKQYDRVSQSVGSAVGDVIGLPRKWVGSLVGERNPKPYKVTKDWEFWLKDGEIYRNARGSRGPISDTGMPANVRWESSKAHFDHYSAKGIYNPATRQNWPWGEKQKSVRLSKAELQEVARQQRAADAGYSRSPSVSTGVKSAGRYKGYSLHKTPDGEFYSSLDRDSLYSTKASVKKSIDEMGRGNPVKHVSDAYRAGMADLRTAAARHGTTNLSPSIAQREEWRHAWSDYMKGWNAEKRRPNPANPEGAAQDMYESFHGKPATSQVIVKEEYHEHEHLATIGVLVNFWVAPLSQPGKGVLIETSDANGDFDEVGADDKTVFLAANEQGTQLYFVGGDQSLDLDKLKFTGDFVKDSMVIGVIYEVTYRTKKEFDKFELTDYYHELGEETGDQPMLVYDSLSPHCAISGGRYKINMPLLGVSPGIEN